VYVTIILVLCVVGKLLYKTNKHLNMTCHGITRLFERLWYTCWRPFIPTY